MINHIFHFFMSNIQELNKPIFIQCTYIPSDKVVECTIDNQKTKFFNEEDINDFVNKMKHIYNRNYSSICMQITPHPVLILPYTKDNPFDIEFSELDISYEKLFNIIDKYLTTGNIPPMSKKQYHFTVAIKKRINIVPNSIVDDKHDSEPKAVSNEFLDIVEQLSNYSTTIDEKKTDEALANAGFVSDSNPIPIGETPDESTLTNDDLHKLMENHIASQENTEQSEIAEIPEKL